MLYQIFQVFISTNICPLILYIAAFEQRKICMRPVLRIQHCAFCLYKKKIRLRFVQNQHKLIVLKKLLYF